MSLRLQNILRTYFPPHLVNINLQNISFFIYNKACRWQTAKAEIFFFFFLTAAAAAAKSLQLCPTLCDPIDGSPPGSPFPGILQAKNTGVGCHFLLQCMKVKSESESLSRVWLFVTPWTAAYQALPSMGFSRQEYWSGVPLPSLECPLHIIK